MSQRSYSCAPAFGLAASLFLSELAPAPQPVGVMPQGAPPCHGCNEGLDQRSVNELQRYLDQSVCLLPEKVAFSNLQAIGVSSVPTLSSIALNFEASILTRIEAVKALGAIGGQHAVETLKDVLWSCIDKNGHFGLQVAVIEALSVWKLSHVRFVPSIITIIRKRTAQRR